MSSLLVAVAAFTCGLLYDYMWARCVECVQHQRAVAAANVGIVLYICALLSTVLIVEKCLWAVVLYGLGNWVGIYLAVKRKQPKQP